MPDNTISLSLSQDAIRLEPGEGPAELVLTVENCSENIADYEVSVLAKDLGSTRPDWITIDQPRIIGLYPRGYTGQSSREDVSIIIEPPASLPAKELTLDIIVANERDSSEVEVIPCRLVIGAIYDFSLRVRPEKQQSILEGAFEVSLTNKGNAPATARLSVKDIDPACKASFARSKVSIPTGKTRNTTLKIRADSISPDKAGRDFKFEVSATLNEDKAVKRAVGATWRQEFPDLALSLSPERQTVIGNEVQLTANLKNSSDETLALQLKLVDPEQRRQYRLDIAPVNLQPGAKLEKRLKLNIDVDVPAGATRTESIEVQAVLQATGDIAATSQAAIEFKPQATAPIVPPAPVEEVPQHPGRKPRFALWMLLPLAAIIGIAIWAFRPDPPPPPPEEKPVFEVPNVIGSVLSYARQELSQSTFYIEATRTVTSGRKKGVIIASTPAAGEYIEADSGVTLIISNGPDTITMPDLRGQEVDNAEDQLSRAGLDTQIVEDFHHEIPPGQVMRTEPSGGEPVVPEQLEEPVMLVVSRGPGSNWPMWGYDEGSTFWNKDETMLYPPLEMLFQDSIVGHNLSVADGVVLMATPYDGNTLHAFDAYTGERLWNFVLTGGAGGAMDVTPAIFDEMAFFGGQGDDNLYAVDLETGQLQWSIPGMGNMYTQHPKIADGILYVISEESILALEPEAGYVIWELPEEGRQAMLAYDNGILLRGTDVMGINGSTGEVIWEPEYSTYFVSVWDSKVFSSRGLEVKAYRTDNGEPLWETILPEEEEFNSDFWTNPMLVVDDALFVLLRRIDYEGDSGVGVVYSLNTQDGTPLVRSEDFEIPLSSVIVGANGVVYICSYKEGLYALDSETLRILWNSDINRCYDLAIANGRLYVASGDGLQVFGPDFGN